MKITEALLAEHAVFHSLFDHVEASAPGIESLPELKSLAALIERMLKAHSVTEDKLFLGPLEHCFEQIGQRDSFLEEHKEMDGQFKLVRKASRLKEARELLSDAINHSRRHFDREERIVFPMAERVLKAKTLNDLGQAWLQARDQKARLVTEVWP